MNMRAKLFYLIVTYVAHRTRDYGHKVKPYVWASSTSPYTLLKIFLFINLPVFSTIFLFSSTTCTPRRKTLSILPLSFLPSKAQ